MHTRKQKRKQRGGQPLSYTNPGYSEPSALPGTPILNSAGTVARPEITQKGGQQLVYTDTGKWIPWTQAGAPLIIQQQKGGQPLSYTNAEYREVSALPGTPLLYSNGTIARPEIGQKGGFTPSVMTNLVGNAAYLTPLAMTAAYRLLSNNKTRKQRGGNGDWAGYQQQAKALLDRVASGKANAKWINKVAKLLKEKKNTAVALAEFANAKDAAPVERPRFATRLNEWEYNMKQARKELVKYGEPTAAEVTHLAALRTGRKGKPENADAYLQEFRQRFDARKEAAAARARELEEKKIRKQIEEAEKALVVAKPPKATGADMNDRPWNVIRGEAKQELAAIGKKLKRGNLMRYASMKRLRDKPRMDQFLEELRARSNVSSASSREESKNGEEEESKVEEVVLPKPRVVKPRVKVAKARDDEEWDQYKTGARRMLEGIGPATISEVSELARKMKVGENIRPFLNEFEERVEKTKVRVAKLAKEKEERKEADREESKYDVEESKEAEVVAKPARVIRFANERPPLPHRNAPVLAAAAPAKEAQVDPGKFARFQARLAELAKKYEEK